MNALFVNSVNPFCGVHAYGKNLFQNLEGSTRVRWTYCEPENIGALRALCSMPSPDAVVYNYSSLIGSFLSDAPFSWIESPQAFVFHDAAVNDRFDAFFFSDPTMTPRQKWHSIGRPLPKFTRIPTAPPKRDAPIFGCHGFIGAWADQTVHRVISEFEYAIIRLLLPYSKYCDADGSQARAMADRCRNMVVDKLGITLEISHVFLPQNELLDWLASNDLNLYIRPGNMNWTGVSSAPDSALAVRKPLAVNKCNAFRHLHGLTPSICVEDRSLLDIISTGCSPTLPFTVKHCDPEQIRQKIEDVLMSPTLRQSRV